MNGPDRPEGKHLSWEEAQTCIEICRESPPLGQICEMMLLTGMRVGEVVRITWADIDLEGKFSAWNVIRPVAIASTSSVTPVLPTSPGKGVVQAMLGHSSTLVNRYYTATEPDEMVDAVEKLSEAARSGEERCCEVLDRVPSRSRERA